jgi:hypothetical protein
LVGATGFEPATPCPPGNGSHSKLLFLLATVRT